jgi:protein-S-isoprenylcysteine O-methyltransferase Ste14
LGSREASVLLILKNLLFTVLVPGTVAVYVPLFLFSHAMPRIRLASIVAAFLLLVGAAMYLRCLWDFATFGRGTPAPIDPPKQLVIRGLYQYSRNPMYVGVLTVIVGWALLFASVSLVLYAVVVAACFHLFVRLYEEPHLKQVFGASYEQYCAQVSRWLSFHKSAAP